mgnify:CR=1 FL=1
MILVVRHFFPSNSIFSGKIELISFFLCAITLIEHHKNDYGTIGEPTTKEVKLERALELKNKEIQKLKAQRDTTDEYAASMQQRSNKASRP